MSMGKISSRLLVAAAAAGLLFGMTACAPEPDAVPTDPTPTQQTPSPTPDPEPQPQPGKGPRCATMHCVSVAMGGDLLFHPGLWKPFALPATTDGQNFDFVPLLKGAKRYLNRADYAICDMETPLAPVGGPYTGYPVFSTPPEVANAAKAVGFDACTTASNHTVDMGTPGLIRTLDRLDEVGLAHTGSYRAKGERNEPLIVEANGVKIAIIAATFSLNGLNAEHAWQVDYGGPENALQPKRAIKKAKLARQLGADIVIGVQHAGTEYATMPDIQQTTNAHTLIDSGEFDFVYNHHTHSIQPFEFYNGRWILYGTGNFISESAPPAQRVNNEFLLSRVQFAQQDDGSWKVNDLAWTVATNIQNGGYKWCPVAADAPQGVCQSPGFDADVLARTRKTVNSMGADKHGLREWNITKEKKQAKG